MKPENGHYGLNDILTVPNDTNLEEVILSAILLGGDAINEVIDILRPEHFFAQQNREIYKCIVELFSEGKNIDVVSVAQKLQQKNLLSAIGGLPYLADLTNKVWAITGLEDKARTIVEKYILRKLIELGHVIITTASDPTTQVQPLVDEIQQRFFNIIEVHLKKDVAVIKELVKEYVEYVQKVKGGVSGLSGVPSGFITLDRITGGFHNSDLVIVASRPGMGKTAFMLNIALNCAKCGHPVGIFSLEMSDEQLIQRMLAIETSIPLEKIKKITTLTDDDMQKIFEAQHRFEHLPIFIDDTPGISIFEIRTKARKLKIQHNISIIFIDYLQLINTNLKHLTSREQEVSYVSRSLKHLAKELDIPVIALSQLNRHVEKRKDYRPMLSDLRESGAIEQDADLIMFLYRPEYYGIKEITDENDNPVQLPKGYTELIIAKHRNGPTDIIKLLYFSRTTHFDDFNFVSGITQQQDESAPNDDTPF